MSIEVELHRMIVDAKWRCDVSFKTIPLSGKPTRVINLTFHAPDGTAPAGFAHKSLHRSQVLHEYLVASELFMDISDDMLTAGCDEDAAGWRTEFDPVANEWQRRNIYDRAAR